MMLPGRAVSTKVVPGFLRSQPSLTRFSETAEAGFARSQGRL